MNRIMKISCGRLNSRAIMRFFALFLVAPLLSIILPQEASANVACQINNASVILGSNSSGSGSIDFTCTNFSNGNRSFTLCASLGTPSSPGTIAQPVLDNSTSGANLNFNVYRDAGFLTLWTPSQSLSRAVSIPGGSGNSVSGSLVFYAAIGPGQTPSPGSYDASFFNMILGFQTSNGATCETTANPQLSGQLFTLIATATVLNNCYITAGSAANLGSVLASTAPVFGSTSININCPPGTSYFIGLKPSNNDSAGLGQLSGTGANADHPPYQLHSVSNSGPVWGNTASSSGVGNGVAGTGNGTDQNYAVFIEVPSSDFKPDSYNDTVTVTVHF